jgi:hypothetical protein
LQSRGPDNRIEGYNLQNEPHIEEEQNENIRRDILEVTEENFFE